MARRVGMGPMLSRRGSDQHVLATLAPGRVAFQSARDRSPMLDPRSFGINHNRGCNGRPVTQQLVDRLDRLEKSMLRWRILAVAASLSVVMLSGIVWARMRQEVKSIRASEFVLADASDRRIVRIGQDAKGAGKAGTVMFDADGERRLLIGMNEADAPFIALFDSSANGGDQLVLDVTPRHGSAIAFRNPKNQSGILLGADPTGVGGLALMDRAGRRVVELGLNPDGSARFTVRSTDGRKVFEVP